MVKERRNAERFDITELIFVTKPGESRAGLLVDVSSQGAGVEFVDPLVHVAHGFKPGDAVNLMIDQLGELPGRVARATDKKIAIEFQVDDQEQEMLVAEIEAAYRDLRGGQG